MADLPLPSSSTMATLAKLTSQSTQTLSLLLERQRLQTLSTDSTSLHLPQITRNLQQLRAGILDLEEKEGNIEAVRLLKSQYERMRGMLGADADTVGIQRCVRRVSRDICPTDLHTSQAGLGTSRFIVQCDSSRRLYPSLPLKVPFSATRTTTCRLTVSRRSSRWPLCPVHRRPGGWSPTVYGRHAAVAERADGRTRPPSRQPLRSRETIKYESGYYLKTIMVHTF